MPAVPVGGSILKRDRISGGDRRPALSADTLILMDESDFFLGKLVE